MRRVRENFLKKLKVEKLKLLLSAFCFLLSAFTVLAQPANDNFASAEDISGINSGLFGSVTNDTTSATAQPLEPSHAGFPANATVWYRWTAPRNGEVQLDTLASALGSETVLAVYTGETLSRLRQVAANDDVFPYSPSPALFQQNISSDVIPGILAMLPFGYTQPFTGPSALRFNARVGTTYYFVVGAKFTGGPIALAWAYHPAGVFRFATEDVDFSTGAPVFRCAESESNGDYDASTFQTYYQFGVPGVLVTVTRLGGSSGRMLVDYFTEDLTSPIGPNAIAQQFFDYLPVQGTLVFDDYEMTKRIMIPIFADFGFGPQTNRDFAVVLANARPDIAESPEVSQPLIDGSYGRAIVRILDVDIDPWLPANFQLDPTDTNVPPVLPPIFQPTNSIFNFGRATFRTVEDVNGYWAQVWIPVVRSGTNQESITVGYRVNNFLGSGEGAPDDDEGDNEFFPLQPGSDYATPHPTDEEPPPLSEGRIHGTNADFTMTGNYAYPGGGSISWGQNDFLIKYITFTITNDNLTEFNEDIYITLYRTVSQDYSPFWGTTALIGMVNETKVTILFDDQDAPAGSVDQFHNPDFGASMVPPVITVPPNQAHPGADSVVYDLAVQPDDKTVIVGDFLSFNATVRNRIARLNVNGSLDTTFNPGSGANDFIGAITLTPSGQFVIGGGFSSYNGTPRVRVARLSGSGSLDNSFNAGAGPDGSVWAVAVQPDGKVIIAGQFTSVAGTTRTHIARLNTNGVLDATFDPGPNGPDGTVWAVALQPDGKVIIGGEFHVIAGQTVGGIARLNDDGTLDTGFFPGAGTDGTVYALARQADGRVVVGGDFSLFDFNPRNNLTRLNTDGSLDNTFDPGSSGADDTVYSITVAGSSLYVSGSFTSFNGTHRRGLVRLFSDGTVDTGFLDTAYNQFAGLHRQRFSDAPGIAFATGLQTDGNVMIAGSFEQVGGGQASLLVRPPDAFDPNLWTEPKARDGLRNRKNVARFLGGSTPGPGNINFTAPSHTANENQSSLSVSLTRNNGTLGFLSANFEVEPGLAQSGVDYIYNAVPPIYLSSWAGELYWTPSEPNSLTRMHSDGLFGDNFVPTDIYGHNWFNYTPGRLVVTILNDNIVQGDRNTTFRLANPSAADIFYLGGENIPLGGALGLSQTPLNIIDDDKKNGVLTLASVNFVVNENVTNAVVTVLRTNGSFGFVSCQYATIVGGSATAGVDYQLRSGTLSFGNNVTSNAFLIPITDDSGVEPDETIFVRISSATGGAALGLSDAVVTIIDNDTPGGKLNFSSATFSTNENAGAAVITVTRSGSSSGTLTVNVAATNGTAIQGADFIGVTNVVTWPNGDVTPKTMIVPLLDDLAIEGNETVNLRLFGPTLNSSPNPASLGAISNATLIILNDDFSGQVSFSAAAYNANENGGPAVITVVRTGGSSQAISVNFATSDFEAFAGSDYGATIGTLNFGPGELSKSFTVPIIDNQFTDGNRSLALTLSGASPPGALGFPNTVFLTIVDDESVNEPPGGLDTVFTPLGMNDAVFALARQNDGELLAGGDFTQANLVPRQRLARLHALDGSVDPTFQASANATVRSVLPQADGRILIGGSFTAVSSVVRNHIARVNPNGSLDTSFDPGSGTDNPVFAVAEFVANGERKVFIGGGFTVFNGVPRNGIARLNNDGSLDTTFNPGLGAAGVVYALAAYPTNTTHAGKVVIAGDFTAVNGIARGRIARLNSDGSVDLSFDPGTGANDAVRALAIQIDGRILIGGSFTNFNGVALNRFARLNTDGSRDATFTPGVGADDTVNSITVQGDTKILLGGQFTRCNGVTRHRITRLNNDGTADPTINFGNGANDFVSATLAQPDGKIVIGGGFTEYDGVPRQRIARIYGGSIAGSGTLEFTAAEYQVDEDGTNALITVRRRGGTSGQTAGASVGVDAVTSDGTAISGVICGTGVNYIGGTHPLVFPEAEVFQSFLIPVCNDFEINPDRTVNLALANISPPGSASLGNQPVATLTIVNDDSAITFASATYTANENVAGGAATIQVVRSGSTRDTATVDFTTTTNGTATAGADYIPVTNTVVFASGETARSVFIPIINDTLIEGNETVTMALTNVIGALLLVPNEATLTIVDNDTGPGQIAFASAGYVVAENGSSSNAVISLVRTNGRAGSVGVGYYTSDGTANAGFDYSGTTGTVSFGDGETNKDIVIPILDDFFVEGNETFFVTLTNATGGAIIVGSNTAPVTIIENDAGFSFSGPVYLVNEADSGVTLTVLRLGGSNGISSVVYTTFNITNSVTNIVTTGGVPTTNVTTSVSAIAGLDYSYTSNILVFADGETLKTFTVSITNDLQVEGDETFGVNLSNPSPASMKLLASNTVVSILDDDAGLAFGPISYSVDEGGTNVVLTVLRTNANTGTIGVSFATSNLTATAGADYTAVAGQLIFTNGQASNTIVIPILEDTQVEGDDEQFIVTLSNPTGGAQIFTNVSSVATVTIVDNDAGVSFSSANYGVFEGEPQRLITVLRTGTTNTFTNTFAVNYSTSDGTATNTLDYLAASGTLVFTNGVMSNTFAVTIIDDTLEEGAETILLSLSSPTGQVSLLNPSAAILTIIDNDGPNILPAGVRLISEIGGTVNGAVDPNETITALFALRASGKNTVNLFATLLPTNGVTSPTPSGPLSYGPLADGGASVSRQFTFTASGTNGGEVLATFQVFDATLNLTGRVTFAFQLGPRTNSFTNSSPITIVDNSPASPYPSSITVTGLVGTVSKVTMMVTNLYHGSPNDIDMLLVGPTGTNTIIMSDAGGGNFITNVTLTFDDAAANSLTSSVITNGTYKPTNFGTADQFPSPAPPSPWGATLSAFNGSNPNGLWSLYIVDDLAIFSGSISRGWNLSITTLGVIPRTADLSVNMIAPPNVVVVGDTLTYSVVVTNHGPWQATGIILTNTLPAGATLVSSNATQGTISSNTVVSGTFTNVQAVWTIGSLTDYFDAPANAVATATFVIRLNDIGSAVITNSVRGVEDDPNLLNNVAAITTTVVNPSADLALGVVAAPDFVFLTTDTNLNRITYTITVTNLSLATATGVTVTNVLPPTGAVVFFDATPAGTYTQVGNIVTFTNLGNLADHGRTNATIIVRAIAAGTWTNTTTVGSAVVDPFRANNTVSVKTVVGQMTFSRVGNNLVIAWPVDAIGFTLVSATNVTLPLINWTPVVTLPVTNGDQKQVTVPIGSGSAFFRLRRTAP